jgi:hypothetical protein
MNCLTCGAESGLSNYCDKDRPGNPTQTGLQREDHSWDNGSEYANTNSEPDTVANGEANDTPSDYGGGAGDGGAFGGQL